MGAPGFRPAIRREAPADLSDVGEDAGLAARIRDEIRGTGPMPFARFMELALYDPSGGYYRADAARPGRGGDFLTAPELHPIFGELLARALAQAWDRLGRPEPFAVVEHGAGEGALAVPLLGALPAPIRYLPVDVDARRLERLRERLATAGLVDRLDSESTETPFDGVILANEVLDALPVHRVRQAGPDLRELAVDIGPDEAFVEIEIPPTTPAFAERLAAEGIELADGQTAEICLALDGWIAAASAPLRRGLLILIDYGAPATELYDPVRRRDGTLRAYVRHQVHADPYRFVGHQDLTAHVDVTAVERAAHAAAGLIDGRHHHPGRSVDGPRHRGPSPRDPGRPGHDVRGLRPAAFRADAPARPGCDGQIPRHGLRARLARRRRAGHPAIPTPDQVVTRLH